MNSTAIIHNAGTQFSGLQHVVDWSDVFTHISPYAFAFLGVAFGLALSVVGAAWFVFCKESFIRRGIWTTASTLMGGCVKAPRIRSKNLIRYFGHLGLFYF